MNKVRAVSAFVPIPVLHMQPQQYHDLAARLGKATGDRLVVYQHPLSECWLSQHNPPLVPAQPTPADRYAAPEHFVYSNIVQHNRTSWAMRAAQDHPDVDVWVWLDYGILKQGTFTGKPVTEDVVKAFLRKVERYDFKDIPFPGIWEKGSISDCGDNWRFCGSTHIWPTKFLPQIDKAYKEECIRFITRTYTVPNDLPVWAHVELRGDLPLRWYAANHDATQLSNFPEPAHDPSLRTRKKVQNRQRRKASARR